MATMSDTAAQSLETATPFAVNSNVQNMNSDDSTPKVFSDYEKCREERIKENLERMQKLGIYDLSLKLKSVKPSTHRKNSKPYKTPNRCISPLPSSVPSRRSSRLQNTPAVSYSEVDLTKKGKDDNGGTWRGDHARPEVYTEEQEKLLGEAKTEWTLFVDGYGKDGKKIYDQFRGKTCHQCRQKTLGHRTHCIKCNLVQGQFCGDCLYMRYGENVLEAKQNPDWICPVCRGICNCSLCRQAKGWAPTGVLYRKISRMGYKSVAHYLIQTHRADPDSDKNEGTENTVCAKWSLPFSKEDIEAQNVIEVQSLDESRGKNVNLENTREVSEHKNLEAEIESGNGVDEDKDENKNTSAELESKIPDTGVEENKNVSLKLEYKIPETGADEGEDKNKNVNPELEYKIPETGVDKGEDRNKRMHNESEDSKSEDEVKLVITPKTKPGSRKKRCAVTEPLVENSIAARLRSRRKCI